MITLSSNRITVHQLHEPLELIGLETRNKYRVVDDSDKQIAFAAEQSQGWAGSFERILLGHWRTFEVHFFTPDQKPFMILKHPFRWLFQTIEVSTADGTHLGTIQQRFSVLKKLFEVHDENGKVMMTMSSPLWKPWTFPFEMNNQEIALIKKKWSGVLSEAFTDRDTFSIEFKTPELSENLRHLILAASIFVDLQYFEKDADD
ncbi:phospholipid scramblase family protein [Sansalvadorimonas sp. 2012CJ34-2]|uniref:Phospholipid scramblase family protein n=1 Tax=Parendozoicomonas callyspongiae TaxID=2942213 RepID=A0ABT0PLT4_9GAMM|nr:phospholipid scramblase family protein [Sansalvadorimonas sp. 2012CJ34-2]MCL6271408.1 phospholipid scramblase family protein [Sansalvadorimonas sp. 2012CJ34-2]